MKTLWEYSSDFTFEHPLFYPTYNQDKYVRHGINFILNTCAESCTPEESREGPRPSDKLVKLATKLSESLYMKWEKKKDS